MYSGKPLLLFSAVSTERQTQVIFFWQINDLCGRILDAASGYLIIECN